MLDLKEVTIGDRAWVIDLMRRSIFRGSEYNFANLYNWSTTYTVRIGRFEDFFIVQSGETSLRFLYPAGSGDVTRAIDAIEEHVRAKGQPLRMYGVNPEARAVLEQCYPGRFIFTPVRDNFDYIYERESLATLKGKKLHGKRNHIARFLDANPDWRYEQLGKENFKEVWEMNAEWCRRNQCDKSVSLQREACAARSGLEHFDELELTGGVLRVGGNVIAFTYGSPVTDDTFDVHVEKAFSDIQGAYPMINQQFVLRELEGYRYVNREDDVGDEGLRRAKESYQPAFLYQRFSVAERDNP